jgi:hypothetical protein
MTEKRSSLCRSMVVSSACGVALMGGYEGDAIALGTGYATCGGAAAFGHLRWGSRLRPPAVGQPPSATCGGADAFGSWILLCWLPTQAFAFWGSSMGSSCEIC